MLEKIGLPSKPSLRGNNWVEDASHCQDCSSQFTFINRKHHRRRYGGLFCGSCKQQRLYLRGQGDAPVCICEPCKKLEEAACFEMRQGHKNRAGKPTDIGDEDGEVTDQDMHDPSYLSLLRSLGCKEEDNNKAQSPPKEENVRASMQTATYSYLDKVHSSIQTGRSRKSKGEIQKELMGLKRKSLALRRQGEVEEAEEVLKMAKVL